MQKRTLKVAILAVLTIALILGLASVAAAQPSQWPDLAGSVVGPYNVTIDQVSSISNGFPDGLWKPYQAITRAQFVKIADAALKIDLVNAATPSFTDVPKTNIYYGYIEGAKAVGMINGVTATSFAPNATISRQDAVAILARYIAKVNGVDLATVYTSAQVTQLLAHFTDAAAIASNLKNEVAFAFASGITAPDQHDMFRPADLLWRIQAAAMIIRSEALNAVAPHGNPAHITLVGTDKNEYLIGQSHTATFNVTDANNHPVQGALVSFDTLFAQEYYVGNIVSMRGALTDAFGNVTVQIVATEPGTQRLSANVNGLAAIYVTDYWLVMDEVYTAATNTGYDDTTTDGTAIPPQNNAGTTHTWSMQVTFFGPGPRSTSEQDWYNATSTMPFDPTSLKPGDGIDASYLSGVYDWNEAFVLKLAKGTVKGITGMYAPRTHAESGAAFPVTMTWKINPIYDPDATIADGGMIDTPEAGKVTTDVDKDDVASVGTISAITSGGTIATGGKSASGLIDANGISTITITSQVTGFTPTSAVADYAGNPYPGTTFAHRTFSEDNHHIDWEPQPAMEAFQLKQWVPHTLPVSSSPLAMASSKDNTGQDELVILTLVDVFGNAIPGYQVEWTLQGVGEFKNVQTVTDATGKATATLYSSEPGQSIVETKVIDKNGVTAYVYTATKQWYQIDDVTFTNRLVEDPNENELTESPSDDLGPPDDLPINVVGTDHTFTVQVSGVKWVWTSTDVNNDGLHNDEVMVISRDSAYTAAGRIINEDGTLGAVKPANTDLPVQTVMATTANSDDTLSPDLDNAIFVTRMADQTLAAGEMWGFAPGNTDMDSDDPMVIWSGLAGKGVDFFNNIGDADLVNTPPTSNTPIPMLVGGDGFLGMPEFVGTIKSFTTPWTDVMYGGSKYHYDAVTDANGNATVTVTSTTKGDQYIYAVADYPGNPQSHGALNAATPLQWSQLRFGTAEKIWVANATGTTSYKVFGLYPSTLDQGGQDDSIAPIVDGNSYTNPVLAFLGYLDSGSAQVVIAPPLAGTQATGVTVTVAGGVVTTFNNLPAGTNYSASDIGAPVTAVLPGSGATAAATAGTVGSTDNAIVQVHVTAGGAGYTKAPTVTIQGPDIGTDVATGTANINGAGQVVSVTITHVGSGYTNLVADHYTVTFTSTNTAAVTVGNIATISGVTNQVATITPVGTTGLTNGTYAATVPAPKKTTAQATAQVAGGVITSFTVTNQGDGYLSVPAVNIYGSGTGAIATAVLGTGNPGAAEVVSLSGAPTGTGYTGGITTEPATPNPNREILAVEVYDQYGNALPDYKVVWQIVQQGTTTSGTVHTYHPYAHFENAAHDVSDEPSTDTESIANDIAGIGDTNSHVKINTIWNNNGSDDNLAWGYTLNGQVNFVESLAAAAHVDLVLDDSRATLLDMVRTDPGIEFSDIVNVTVYDPSGAQYAQFTQIKNWTLTAPVLTNIDLKVSELSTGPWVNSLTTNIQNLFDKVVTTDQYGNASPANDIRIKVAGPVATVLTVGPVNGILVTPFHMAALAGTYTFTAWFDANHNNTIDVGEMQSNAVTVIVP